MGGILDIKYAFLQRKEPPLSKSVRNESPPRDEPRRAVARTSDYRSSSSYDDFPTNVSSYSLQSGYNNNYPYSSYSSQQSYPTRTVNPNNYSNSGSYSSPNYGSNYNNYGTTGYAGTVPPLSPTQGYVPMERPDPNKVVLETMSQYAQSLANASNSSYQVNMPMNSVPVLSNPSTTAAAPVTAGSQSHQQLQQLVNLLLAQQQQLGTAPSTYSNNYSFK